MKIFKKMNKRLKIKNPQIKIEKKKNELFIGLKNIRGVPEKL